jgi:hypothetical protein
VVVWCGVVWLCAVVVSVLLLHRLVREGWLRAGGSGGGGGQSQRLGILALAGVHVGPYPDIPNDLFAATRELFALSAPHHFITRKYWECCVDLLNRGVKVHPTNRPMIGC